MKQWILILIILLVPVVALGQEKSRKPKKIEVTGVVMNEGGVPAAGAQILVDNRNSGVVTAADGSYKIKVKPSTETLAAFSLFGGMHEVEYNGESELNFVLGFSAGGALDRKPEGEKVTTGYGEVNRDEATTSVSTVNLDKAENTRYTTIYEMIKGEVAGVVVSGNRIVIRGGSSMTGNNEPLYVVNGVIVDQISDIPPSIVESIEVLKGTSAAIYGSKGANGVIVIRTR